MKLALGCDHGGFPLMKEVKAHLNKLGIEYTDYGTYSEESCDYPVFAEKVANAIVGGECDKGILICGTGLGITISANKIHGIRAALCTDCFMAEMSRAHNNANILGMGARVIGPGLALKIVDTFLNTEFLGGRHAKRVDMMMALENK